MHRDCQREIGGKKVETHWTFGIEEGCTGGNVDIAHADEEINRTSGHARYRAPNFRERRCAEGAPNFDMFSQLSDKLQEIFKDLRGHGKISESNINDALRQVRLALLEADVDFQVAKNFIARVKEKALGEEVLRSITPGPADRENLSR